MLPGVAKAVAQWRRIVTAAVRVSVFRSWAAARAGKAPARAAPPAANRNLLYETVEGRIALADALVASAGAPGRSWKRKVEELSSPPPSSAEPQLSSRPRPPQRGPLSFAAALSARAGAASAMA